MDNALVDLKETILARRESAVLRADVAQVQREQLVARVAVELTGRLVTLGNPALIIDKQQRIARVLHDQVIALIGALCRF